MMRRVVVLSLAMTALLSWGTSLAGAFVAEIDTFTITRNGSLFFTDPFSDGVSPPSAPSPFSYGVQGTFPAGSESGGLLTLNTINGALSFNAQGVARRTLGATLLTDTSSDLSLGLKVDDTLLIQGTFVLVPITGPLFQTYGLQLIDALPGGATHQLIQLFVQFDDVTTHTVRLSYILQNFDAQTIIGLGSVPFAPPAGADEITLSLSRPDTSNDQFFASWTFLASGVPVGGGSFATPGLMFQGENFVRARFFASDSVPLPGSLVLVALGGCVLACARRWQSLRK